LAYIGKNPTTGSFIYADDISTSSTNTYNILVGGVAFSPESANHCIVSLNGVIQKANTSFSISGSQITFLPSSGTLSSSDSIDFILILGSVNDVGVATTVTDSAITKGKLNLISDSSSAGLTVKGDGSSENGTIQLNCSQNSHGVKISSPAHSAGQSYELILPTGNVTADKVLKVASVSGSGATGIGQLSFGDAGGITEADFFFLPSDITSNGFITSFTRATTGFSKLGTGMSHSSGVFTFPSTGLYEIRLQGEMDSVDDDSFFAVGIYATIDGSGYNEFSRARGGSTDSGGDTRLTTSTTILFDVTDTSTHKVKMNVDSLASGTLVGASAPNYRTHVIFKRLGNT
jgi:hypothetical protein